MIQNKICIRDRIFNNRLALLSCHDSFSLCEGAECTTCAKCGCLLFTSRCCCSPHFRLVLRAFTVANLICPRRRCVRAFGNHVRRHEEQIVMYQGVYVLGFVGVVDGISYYFQLRENLICLKVRQLCMC